MVVKDKERIELESPRKQNSRFRRKLVEEKRRGIIPMHYCERCQVRLSPVDLRTHLEQCHVGRAPEEAIQLLCGQCPFKASKLNIESIATHCQLTRHSASLVRLEWQQYQEMETHRIQLFLQIALEILSRGPDHISNKSSLFPQAPKTPEAKVHQPSSPLESQSERQSPHLNVMPVQMWSGLLEDTELQKNPRIHNNRSRNFRNRGTDIGSGERLETPLPDLSSRHDSEKNYLDISKASVSSDFYSTGTPSKATVSNKSSASYQDRDMEDAKRLQIESPSDLEDRERRKRGKWEEEEEETAITESRDRDSDTIQQSTEVMKEMNERIRRTNQGRTGRKRSSVWKHFVELPDQKGSQRRRVKCLLCPRGRNNIRSFQKTSNLMRHLRTKHNKGMTGKLAKREDSKEIDEKGDSFRREDLSILEGSESIEEKTNLSLSAHPLKQEVEGNTKKLEFNGKQFTHDGIDVSEAEMEELGEKQDSEKAKMEMEARKEAMIEKRITKMQNEENLQKSIDFRRRTDEENMRSTRDWNPGSRASTDNPRLQTTKQSFKIKSIVWVFFEELSDPSGSERKKVRCLLCAHNESKGVLCFQKTSNLTRHMREQHNGIAANHQKRWKEAQIRRQVDPRELGNQRQKSLDLSQRKVTQALRDYAANSKESHKAILDSFYNLLTKEGKSHMPSEKIARLTISEAKNSKDPGLEEATTSSL